MRIAVQRPLQLSLLVVLLLYAALHLLSLARFPLMHSDEAWLAGLTRTMAAEGSLFATERFFALVPRHPHALRILYHLIQLPFIALSWSLFATRLPSLITGAGLLLILFRWSGRMNTDPFPAAALLLALDVQFWYAAHFGRQEIFILLCFALALSLLERESPSDGTGSRLDTAVAAGMVIGAAAGFHPNAFVAALGTGGYLVGKVIAAPNGQARRRVCAALGIVAVVSLAWGLFWVLLSLAADPHFFRHYREIGTAQGVTRSLLEKLLRFPFFFSKLWRGLSGTYYTPDIRLQLVLFGASFLSALVGLCVSSTRPRLLAPLGAAIGSCAGILLIGKYSPPSVVLLFLPGYLLLDTLLASVRVRPVLKRTALLLVAFSLGTVTLRAVLAFWPADYGSFVAGIEEELDRPFNEEKTAAVLGNLNMAFAFPEASLRDYRDLGYLRISGFDLEGYIRREGINTVILTPELAVIWAQRPVWNELYGNPYYWYGEMNRLLETRGELVAEIPAPWYGVRLMHRVGEEAPPVRIYRINPAASDSSEYGR